MCCTGRDSRDVRTRLNQHKAGTKVAWIVKRYGLRLLPDSHEHLNPMPYEAGARWRRTWRRICAGRVTRSLAGISPTWLTTRGAAGLWGFDPPPYIAQEEIPSSDAHGRMLSSGTTTRFAKAA